MYLLGISKQDKTMPVNKLSKINSLIFNVLYIFTLILSKNQIKKSANYLAKLRIF